jgi:hypothetical protein
MLRQLPIEPSKNAPESLRRRFSASLALATSQLKPLSSDAKVGDIGKIWKAVSESQCVCQSLMYRSPLAFSQPASAFVTVSQSLNAIRTGKFERQRGVKPCAE